MNRLIFLIPARSGMCKVLTEGWGKDDHNFSALSLGKSWQLFEKACTYVLPELAVLTVDITVRH